ncbi:DNA mismatch repair protein MutT [Desulfonema ishimotonii]|uniref:DNA mismatch repair protein MutT n=1 Tax=Desulfonema ishimotonii TaxID=45657 RepID=A0A401FTE0_9BACT|nr:NUDIX domain-containing protein [Desulfonema ishimotonii]GBC60220.1 DNA mismatch repair protein MutT [Desulfonema ishimotonii]
MNFNPRPSLFCPRCGSEQFKNRNTKSFICDQCGFEYFHNVATAAAGIIEIGNQIILTRRARNPKKGMLDLPGGFVDYGESAEEGLRREIREELNLDIREMAYLTSFPNIYWYKNVKYNTLDMLFVCKTNGIKKIRPQDDVADFHFISPWQIAPKQIAFPSVRKGLQHYLALKQA